MITVTRAATPATAPAAAEKRLMPRHDRAHDDGSSERSAKLIPRGAGSSSRTAPVRKESGQVKQSRKTVTASAGVQPRSQK